MPRRCLVTGGTGFVGSELTAQLLARGDRVRTVSRAQRSIAGVGAHHALDLSAPGELPTALMDGVETVFHLAGRAHVLSDRDVAVEDVYTQVNVESTGRLLRAAVRAGVSTFVFVSSAKAAGPPPASGAGPVDELMPTPPDTPYGRSKLLAEHLVLTAGREHGMHACNLRPVLVYGPGVRGNLHSMLRAVDRRVFPSLPELHNRRSLVHVGDVARAALLAAEHPAARGETFLVTDGEAYSTRRLYTATAHAMDRAVPPLSVPLWSLRALARTGDHLGRWTGRRAPIDTPALQRLVESAWYSSDKIRRILGFTSRMTFEAGLPEMVARYRASVSARS